MALHHPPVSRPEATGSPTKASPTTPTTGMSTTLHPSPQRHPAQPTAHSLSPRAKMLQDARLKRGSPPKPVGLAIKEGSDPSGGARGNVKSRVTASAAAAKPLVPITERRSQEDKNLTLRTRGDGSCDKADITPDGGSAGRDGRQFTVSNVGNNGRIYLRPSIRPPHQRTPQPHFVFPMTPPATAHLDTLAEKNLQNGHLDDFASGLWSPAPSTPATVLPPRLPGPTRRPTGHRRALSDSTTPEDSDAGGLKIVISRPADERRPKTMENGDPQKGPLMDVEIPSWRIGNPRFTLRGTPVFRGSSYAPTEEFPGSSNVSFLHSQTGELTPLATSRSSKRPSPITVPQFRLPSFTAIRSPPVRSPRLPAPYRSTYFSTHVVVEPAMFDSLTFQPACDDKTIVRYSPNGAVTAATPPRLVAEITSPSFLDYELISDFFLTYRTFMEPSGLVKMLMARLRWALDRDDEVGLVVRVRTFVAIRHWMLNYFVDDFVVDYALRVSFCNLLNDLVDELSQDAVARKGQLKILAELKKCWRRVCAQFWDGPEFDASRGPDGPIAPGGIAGHRSPSLDPSFWEKADMPLRLSTLFAPSHQASRQEPTVHANAGSPTRVIHSQVHGHRPTTPEQGQTNEPERQQASPTSVVSVDVLSCSFPGKISRTEQFGANHPLAVHPIPSNSAHSNAPAVATTPRAVSGKRARPSPGHKRNGSLSDSLREKTHTSPGKSGSHRDTEHTPSFPFPGSLVRGNLLPPGRPFVEIVPLGKGDRNRQRQTTIFEAPTEDGEKCTGSAMSGQGMRKLIGSVRRALSTKGQGVSPNQGGVINIPTLGPRGATTNRLPGTPVVPQGRARQTDLAPPIRIDLLGAQIAEDFDKAIREDAAAEAERQDLEPGDLPGGLPLHGVSPDGAPDLSEAYREPHADVFGNLPLPGSHLDDQMRPMSDTGITTGSKSIVIVDDTFLPGLASGLPGMPSSTFGTHSSVAHLTGEMNDGMKPPTNADPTPPNTPPDHSAEITQQLQPPSAQRAVRRSLSSDNLPPFVPDLATLGHGHSPRLSENGSWPLSDVPSQPSMGLASRQDQGQSQSRHPVSGFAGFHRRQRSARTDRSLNSILHRHVAASIRTGLTRESTVRSFDATTYTGTSVADVDDTVDNHEDPVPQPLRILRRRPGGNLRAATNVGELNAPPLSRSRSVGSLTTYSESLRSSYLQSPDHESSGFVDVASSGFSPDHGGTFSIGAVAPDHPGKWKTSLFISHSSKPVMRPSFEAEAQKLAQIPDDDDDGGVESALAKLEGKYEKKTFKLSIVPSEPSPEASPEELVSEDAHQGLDDDGEMKDEHHHLHVGDGDDTVVHHHQYHHSHHDEREERHDDASSLFNTDALHVPRTRPHTEARSFLSDNSGVSYSSTPLLERGFTDDGRSKTETSEWRDKSVLFGSEDFSPTPTPRASLPTGSQHSSYEFVLKTRSMEEAPDHDYEPPPSATQQSFLEDDSGDEGTDLSSELSMDAYDSEDGAGYVFAPSAESPVGRKLPLHPLGEPENYASESRPPSPPMTLLQALQMSPSTANVPQLYDHQIRPRKPLPPTPDITPTALQHPKGPNDAGPEAQDGHGPAQSGDGELPKNFFSVHLPFILAFESEVLAEQFTLIEKDALNEVDWRELIEMNWKHAASNDSRSWVDFLRNTDAHSVEVVIARFNIMVKWACSEIVLTRNMEERVRCIIKLIHVAAHCRRHRNFATMSQITIALTSQEIARLCKTWEMVPPHDLKTLSELESLLSPTRNFYNLRAEMEGGSDSGCIPFVGIYTHDLLFNAQRPSEIASSPTTAPLVNFERCRYAAAIVKTLLRLLEASTLYQFQPVEGLTERCLWMSALSDDEIRRHSQSLE